MKKLLKNCRIISPDVDIARGYVIVENDTITAVGMGDAPQFDGEILDLDGKNLLPGFIDIHFHGCMGQDFNDASLQGLCQMASYELQNGITSICPATMTLPEENLQQIVNCSKLFGETHWDKKMANLLGINLEGPFISEQKKGAQNSKYILPPDSAMFKRLLDASQGFLKLTTLAPETKGAKEFMFPIQ